MEAGRSMSLEHMQYTIKMASTSHSTVTLSVIVKLEAVCVVTSLIPRPSVVTSLIIYKCESTVIVAKFRYVCV